MPAKIRHYLARNKLPEHRSEYEKAELEAAENDLGRHSRFMTDEEKLL
jgi:hypothetical protein